MLDAPLSHSDAPLRRTSSEASLETPTHAAFRRHLEIDKLFSL